MSVLYDNLRSLLGELVLAGHELHALTNPELGILHRIGWDLNQGDEAFDILFEVEDFSDTVDGIALSIAKYGKPAQETHYSLIETCALAQRNDVVNWLEANARIYPRVFCYFAHVEATRSVAEYYCRATNPHQ